MDELVKNLYMKMKESNCDEISNVYEFWYFGENFKFECKLSKIEKLPNEEIVNQCVNRG